jgi:hypothetical protein
VNHLWIIPLVLMVGAGIGFFFGSLMAASRAADDSLECSFALGDQRRIDYLTDNQCDVLYDPSVGWIVIPALAKSQEVATLISGDTLRSALDSGLEEVAV